MNASSAAPVNGADVNLMIKLCNESYMYIDLIEPSVALHGQEITWGPAQLVSSWDISYSLAFVCKDVIGDTYSLVLRGTNYLSLYSWLSEDFDIENTVALNTIIPGAPGSANVTDATANGFNDLLQLVDPSTGVFLVDYLKALKPSQLRITGHSLGGTLTPVMYSYLLSQVYSGVNRGQMSCYSFAGLVPGDSGFAAYFDGLYGNAAAPWRFVNPLDVAPLCFAALNLTDFQNIYQSTYPWTTVPKALRVTVDTLFVLGDLNDLTQLDGAYKLPNVPNPAETSFVSQAAYQHHGKTYEALIKQQFPIG